MATSNPNSKTGGTISGAGNGATRSAPTVGGTRSITGAKKAGASTRIGGR